MSWLTGRASALCCLALALVLYFWIVPSQTEDLGSGFGPASMPRAMAALMGLGALLALLEPAARDTPDWRELRGGVKYLVLACLGALAIRWIGLLPTAPVLALAVMALAGERRPAWLAAGAAGTPALLWLIFDILLQRPLP